MRSQALVLAAALSVLGFVLAGCASHAKPLAAAAQPASLSVPQTHVALPPEQPLDPDALSTEASAAGPAPVAPAAAPAAPTAPAVAPRVRRPAPAVAAQPAEPPAVQPAEAPVERPTIQALVPAQEQQKLKDSTEARKKEVRATLARMAARRLSPADQDLVKRIEFFLSQSDQAERRGDMSQADAFAQRAQDLARGWQ
jgi:outer membrane murein-binding lipoprotein Lpp